MILPELLRATPILTHEVCDLYHSETEMMRYMHRLKRKDLALNQAMLSFGSCTMKLSAAAEMILITWPEFAELHPFCPPLNRRRRSGHGAHRPEGAFGPVRPGPFSAGARWSAYPSRDGQRGASGSASILPIRWMYIRMMGAEALKQAS